jgi:DNA-binding NarL/FixJ family response regulator
MAKPNLLIVDDHVYFRKATISLLQNHSIFNKIWEAESAAEAIHAIQAQSIQLIFLDARLKEGDGLDVTDYVKKNKLNIPIIAITSFSDRANIMHLARAGVRSILIKSNLEPDEMLEVIQTVLAGNRFFPLAIKSLIDENIDKELLPVIRLTEREKQLLHLLKAGQTSKEIAFKMNLTTASVDTYRKRLVEKTQTGNTQDLIGFAYRNGLLD